MYISCFARVLFHLISYIYIFAILIFCYFYMIFRPIVYHGVSVFCCYILIKSFSLRLARPKSSSVGLSFQFILFEIVSNSDSIDIR